MASEQRNFTNFHTKAQEIQKEKKNIVLSNAIEYCENTTIHGFSYWVSCESLPQKLFWVATVVAGLFCACLINSSAVQGWIDKPATTVIQTFSKVNIFLNNERRIVSLKYLLPSLSSLILLLFLGSLIVLFPHLIFAHIYLLTQCSP